MSKISSKQYAQALFELTEGKDEAEIDKIIKKFLVQVKKNDDWKLKNEIIDQFVSIYNKSHNIVEAEVSSSRQLTQDQIKQIEDFIKDKYNAKQVNITQEIDKDLIGGIVIRANGEVIDMSVHNKMQQLHKKLTNVI